MIAKHSTFHTFHIPVMGIGFTIDTPVRVAHLGINSVVSIMDDLLIEKMREKLSNVHAIPYKPIDTGDPDCRSGRITKYLDLLNEVVQKKFMALKELSFDSKNELTKYFDLLPESAPLKRAYRKYLGKMTDDGESWLKDQMQVGEIDVNIMSKVDRVHYKSGKPLERERNDAHTALKGYAESKLTSSIVFSAGMNPALVDYTSRFEDFYPDRKGRIRKRIILKVSDLRSARIQSKFYAKKGLWISEYRVESGLNCGGHAFATDGYLFGPILEEFKAGRNDLIQDAYELFVDALEKKGRELPEAPPGVRFSAQGGVGTAEEHEFLIDHYQLDSIGWGSPFLLVPEATCVDPDTLERLRRSKEEDLYLSNVSPLGISFNNLRGNTKDTEKEQRIMDGQPGSPCTNKFLVSDTTYTSLPACTASRTYQSKAIKHLDETVTDKVAYRERFNEIVEKSCICVGLTTSALLVHDLDTESNGDAVSVCPGPNLAYFSEILTLQEMVDHIYGRGNAMQRTDRPHMFVKELGMYLDHLQSKISRMQPNREKFFQYVRNFDNNLKEGITYYLELFRSTVSELDMLSLRTIENLNLYRLRLEQIVIHE